MAASGLDACLAASMSCGTDMTGPGASSAKWFAAKTVRSRVCGAEGAGVTSGARGGLPRLRASQRAESRRFPIPQVIAQFPAA